MYSSKLRINTLYFHIFTEIERLTTLASPTLLLGLGSNLRRFPAKVQPVSGQCRTLVFAGNPSPMPEQHGPNQRTQGQNHANAKKENLHRSPLGSPRGKQHSTCMGKRAHPEGVTAKCSNGVSDHGRQFPQAGIVNVGHCRQMTGNRLRLDRQSRGVPDGTTAGQ